MLKLISKLNCERCQKVKDYLAERQIVFTEIQSPEEDLDVYRQMLKDNNKELGFPVLLKNSQIINGTFEEISSWLNREYPEPKERLYFWAH